MTDPLPPLPMPRRRKRSRVELSQRSAQNYLMLFNDWVESVQRDPARHAKFVLMMDKLLEDGDVAGILAVGAMMSRFIKPANSTVINANTTNNTLNQLSPSQRDPTMIQVTRALPAIEHRDDDIAEPRSEDSEQIDNE